MTVFELETASHELAREAVRTALQLQDSGELVVHDAAVIDDHEVVASLNPAAFAAAVPSALLGAIIGTLFAGPVGLLIGGFVGAGSGALTAKLADTGLPHEVVERLRRDRHGDYAVALLVSDREGGHGEDVLRQALAKRGHIRMAAVTAAAR